MAARVPTKKVEPVEPEAVEVTDGEATDAEPVEPVEEQSEAATSDRIETYEATRPGGAVVTVRHNIETGETEIVS